MQVNHHRIIANLRETIAQEIIPLWRNLEVHHIELKQADDAVTVAERAC